MGLKIEIKNILRKLFMVTLFKYFLTSLSFLVSLYNIPLNYNNLIKLIYSFVNTFRFDVG